MDYLQFALDNARTEFGETMIDPARPVPSDYRPLNMNYTRPVRLDDVCGKCGKKKFQCLCDTNLNERKII